MTYIQAYIRAGRQYPHAYIHTYIHAHIHACRARLRKPGDRHTYIQADRHPAIHTYAYIQPDTYIKALTYTM